MSWFHLMKYADMKDGNNKGKKRWAIAGEKDE